MKIIDVAKGVSEPNPHHVDARKIYESPHAMAVMITLQPGEALKKHITTVDAFFMCWKDPASSKLVTKHRQLETMFWLKIRQRYLTGGAMSADRCSVSL